MHSKRTLVIKGIRSALIFAIVGSVWAWDGSSAWGNSPSDTVHYWGAFFGLRSGAATGEASVPTPITLPGPVAEVATSNSTEYALLTNGTVYAWGDGTDGELGNGTNRNSVSEPVEVKFPSGVRIESLATDAMPFNTALAIDTDGNAWGWGSDSFGQLCLGNEREYLSPVELPLPHVTLVAGAFDHALYDSEGTVYACGGNANGDLGDGSTGPSSSPVVVTGLGQNDVTGLYASYNNSGALLADGEYFDWGRNTGGQLGRGTTARSSVVPVEVPLSGSVTQVALGGSLPGNGQTMVELSNGTYWAWGTDSSGQLGNDSTTNEFAPIQVYPPGGVSYSLLASGGATTYGVTPSGNVYAWGNGSTGQLGDGKKTTQQLIPVMVESGANNISSTGRNVATAEVRPVY
jgi:alpha-tubulin suppressor-like RCC1 family protein